jgi:hypothetical protein
MSKAEDRMREHGFYNGHTVAQEARTRGLTPVYISWQSGIRGRMYRPPSWHVVDVDRKTDPEGHWSNYGNKAFDAIMGRTRDQQRIAACAWADRLLALRYDVAPTPWVALPGLRGCLFPKPTADLIRRLLREGYVRDRNAR